MTYTDHLISLGIGVAGYFLSLLIHRLWSKITMTDTQRRLKIYEAEKAKLDNLSKSDRALIIHGFQAVFVVFGVLFIISGLAAVLASKGPDELIEGKEIMQLLLWSLPSLACIGAVMSFQKIADHPKSLEKIDAKITKLREKISPNRED